MNEQVFVRFGATTTDLDKGADRAVADIRKVRGEATGLNTAFSGVRERIANLFSNIPGFDRITNGINQVKQAAGGSIANLVKLDQTATQVAVGGLLRIGAVAGIAAGAILAVAAAAGGVAFAGLYAMSKSLAEAGVEVDKLSQKLGMSHRDVQAWSLVAKQASVDATQLTGGVQMLSRNMVLAANGSKRQAAAFAEIGINAKQGKTSTEAFLALADKFQAMENGPKKTALAFALLGQRGTELIPVLNEGSEGLRGMMKAAEETGAVMSDDLIAASKELDSNLNTISLGTQGLKNDLMEALAPAMVWVTEKVKGWVLAMVESYKTGGAVKKMIDVLVGTIKVLITITIGVAEAFRAAFSVIKGAVMLGVHAVTTFAGVMAKVASGDFAGAWAAGSAGAKAMAGDIKSATTGVVNSVRGAVANIKGLWSGTLPKGSGGGEFGGDTDLDLGMGRGGRTKKGRDGSAEARRKAKEELDAKLAALDREMEAVQNNYDREMALEQQKLDLLKAFYGENSKEYQNELKKKEQMEREHVSKLKEIERDRVQHQQQLDEIIVSSAADAAMDRVDAARMAADQEVNLAKMSETERAQAEVNFVQQESQLAIQHEEQMYQIKLKSMRDQLALLDPYSDAYRQMNQKIEVAERQHQATMAQIQRSANSRVRAANNQVVNASISKWKGIVAPITSAVGNAINGLLTRTMTLRQALIGVCDSILSSFVNMGVQMLTNWIATQLGIRAASTATKAAEAVANTTAAATQTATAIAANVTQILSTAPVAGAAAFASTAAIPIVGPVLAPGAAAAAMGAVYAMAPLAVAARGYDIPAGVNPLTQLHEKEMVLPAYLAEPLRRSLSGASPRASLGVGAAAVAGAAQTRSETALRGGDNRFDYSPTLNAKTQSLHELLQNEGRAMRRWFQNQVRNGSLKIPGMP